MNALAIFHLLLACLVSSVTAGAKTLCARHVPALPTDLYPYQRIELANLVDCVERCVEAWHFCRAVAFVGEEQRDGGGGTTQGKKASVTKVRSRRV
jgi:hypothetical protein